MTAYVHIGASKTGTTTLQRFLFENTRHMNKYSLYFSENLGRNFRSLGRDFTIEHIRFDNFYNTFKEDIKKFEREVKNIKGDLILSNEGLYDFYENTQQIFKFKNFMNEVGIDNIKIIVYIRDSVDLAISWYLYIFKVHKINENAFEDELYKDRFMRVCNHCTLKMWEEAFGKENLIVKLFDKNEFYKGDLIKDFLHIFNLELDEHFVIPSNQNEALDLLGVSLKTSLVKSCKDYDEFNLYALNKVNSYNIFQAKDPSLKFMPKKEIYESYITYFEESNEWVRKEFFPHKERLFPKKDLSTYKENYELKEMKPEYWDRIANFIVDFAKDRKSVIDSKQNEISSLNNLLNFTKEFGTAKARIHNHLAYKLGQALIENSKSIKGYIRLPYVLSYIKDKHKKEQKIYNEKIKDNPSLKFPPLESYPDYKDALREKNCITYKLGEALIENMKRGGIEIYKIYERCA